MYQLVYLDALSKKIGQIAERTLVKLLKSARRL